MKTPDIPLKIEKAEIVEFDMNDNFQETLFDVEIKVEKEIETTDGVDWCVSFESCGDLLEPLFFKEVTEPQRFRCPLCFINFSESSAILKHNLSHLRVTVVNPTVFQCDCCASYFTEKQLIESHIRTNNQNVSKTTRLSYKPKAHKSTNITEETDSDYKLANLDMLNYPVINNDNGIIPKNYEYNQEDNFTDLIYKLKAKPKDGMTNLLGYKPKTYKPSENIQNYGLMPKKDTSNKVAPVFTNVCVMNNMHQCHICRKTYTYKTWHEHMQTVHGDGGFFCGLCNKEFKCERYFLKHMTAKHDSATRPTGAVKKNIRCDQCDAILRSSYALTTHKRNVHSHDKHVCHICNSKLKCKSYLLAHMRRVHYNDGKQHFCECGKSFKSPRYLRVHKKNAHSK